LLILFISPIIGLHASKVEKHFNCLLIYIAHHLISQSLWKWFVRRFSL